MADEFRYLDPSRTTLTNLSGAVEDTHEDPTQTQDAWLIADDGGTDTQVDGTFNEPSGSITGTQNFATRVRSTSNGNGGAEVTITLDDGSTPVSGTVLSSGETRVFDDTDGLTLDAADITDHTAVDFTIDGAQGGGMAGSRDTVEVGAVEWAVQLDQTLAVNTLDPTSVQTNQATLEGDLSYGGFSGDAEVWFEWREMGDSTWNETTRQVFSSSTSFSETVTLNSDTEYEYRAQAERQDGDESDTGSIVTFWTLFTISGTVTAGGSAANGAIVYITNHDTDEIEAIRTTDSNGNYSADVPGGAEYHIAAQFDDGSTYAGKSYPFVSGQ